MAGISRGRRAFFPVSDEMTAAWIDISVPICSGMVYWPDDPDVRFCTYNGWDKFDLRKQMEKRGISILDVDVEYGESGSGQTKLRGEAFLEVLETR
jgi:benzoyl-CoA reductase/2-hydroxyglutaryl-CoA dehydratase subunit BcrC/BadD/HgdB